MSTDSDVGRIKLHFAYCMLIATLVFVGLATSKWSEQENFTTYLGNAATMTSLFLGLVAIFYSFVSNNGLSQSLGSISTVSNEVRSSKEQIAQFLDQTKSARKENEHQAHDIKVLSDEIRGNLAQITESISGVSRQHEELSAVLSQIPKRFDDLNDRVGRALLEKAPVTTNALIAQGELSEEDAKSFLARSSKYGLFTTYALGLASKAGIPVSPKSIGKAAGGEQENRDYMLAYMICMNAIGLVAVEAQTKSVYEDYVVSYIHPYLLSHARERLILDGKQGEAWHARLKRIEKLFEAEGDLEDVQDVQETVD